MVGLDGAGRDQRVAPLRERIRHQEFELARLVAALRQPGAIVALDPEARSADDAAQAVEGLERRWRMRQADAGKTIEEHGEPLCWR